MRCLLVLACTLACAPAFGQTAAPKELTERMASWSRALGVTCAHCHVDGAWTDASKPAFNFAQRMSAMVTALNTRVLNDLEPITCWTCHRGQARPARLPRQSWETIQAAHTADFASKPERALAMSVYSASLGVECSHCHEPGQWAASSKPAHAIVTKMGEIFDEIPKHFDKARMPNTQCYMCHQGQRIPERRPR